MVKNNRCENLLSKWRETQRSKDFGGGHKDTKKILAGDTKISKIWRETQRSKRLFRGRYLTRGSYLLLAGD